MEKRRYLLCILAISLTVMSCSLPLSGLIEQPTTVPTPSIPATLPPTATLPGEPSPTATALIIIITATTPPTEAATVVPTECTPTITANQDANIRSGPGTVYDIVGALPKNGTATVAGKNSDGTWWYIEFSGGDGGHAWIAASLTMSTCIPITLASITAPPTPLPPTGTCKDGYEYRLIKSSDKVCVTSASKAQAEADNAAASSRTLVGVYGTDACKIGYVWRGAYSGDHVCVTNANHAQALADNAAASTRWTSGAYGAHTCISGYVWREATSGDDVCVTPAVRTQTQSDNSAASSRKASSTTCISGYVWREAFSGDKVCVTPAIHDQVATDNAAAPSHTW
jgi:hypothetical protein